MPIAVTPEQLALQQSIRDWAERADPVALVRRLEPGSPPGAGRGGPPGAAGPAEAAGCWDDLASLGIFSIAVPAGAGGAAGTVADLAAALEQIGDALVPGPVLPTLLAGLILARLTGLPAAQELLPALADGKEPVAVGFTNATMAGAWLPGGALRVTGEISAVLGAGSTTRLLLGADTGHGEAWFLLEAGQPGVTVTSRAPLDFSRSLASVRLSGLVIGPEQILPGLSTAAVRDLAATLCAAEASAVAGWCSRTAAQHARTRHQFGRPIGAFQAVKHLCAGMLCRAERAAVLAWDAARAADEAPGEHPLAAAAAAALALDDAVDNAKDCIQVLGGIGFTWEHDAHLYLRRALALRQLLGGSGAWRARAAQLALAGTRRRLGVNLASTDAGPTDAGTAGTGTAGTGTAGTGTAGTGTAGTGTAGTVTVTRARAVAATVAALPPERQRAALADAGYLAPHWPPPYGLAASAAQQLVIDEELSRAGVSRPDLVIGGWAGTAIIEHGTPAQRERFAGPTLRGEISWCQLFSEPDAGSDLASLRTRAEQEPGGWRLTGQKVWTSLAREADWAICLARTDPAAPKHHGLTFFLVDMRSAGIDIRPLREITGRAVFNEVFLDQVFVPGGCVVGEPGEGWRVARSTLAAERVAMGRGSALGMPVEGLLSTVLLGGPGSDPGPAEQLGALVAEGLAVSLMDLRRALAQLRGAEPGVESAVAKLAGVAHRQAVAEAALTLCGPDGAAADGAAADAADEFLLTRCLSIAGGTTQILLSMIAERGLGLPREEAR